jgi:hypothetical protein
VIWRRVSSIEELFQLSAPNVQKLAQAARERVLEVVPHATENVRGGWGLIGYNAPAYFAFIALELDHVRIGFEWGILLADPDALLEGSGSQVRYVSIRTLKDLRRRALVALLREAAALQPPPRTRRKRQH